MERVYSITVVPVGFESLGVRSMCTFVETGDVRILIDAGVALGPRFGMKPHPLEYQARAACRTRIKDYAAKSDIIIISHYHNDHHTPNYTEPVWLGSSAEEAEQIYCNKTVILKSIRDSVNLAQRKRGWMFQRFLKTIGSICQVADGAKFEFGKTIVRMSEPVPHGEETSGLGWVLMTTIESEQTKIMHASDVQGPMSKRTTSAILEQKPDLLLLGGPPFYLEKVKVSTKALNEGVANAIKIARKVPTVIFEHHALRSEKWIEDIKPIQDAGDEVNYTVITAAEYLGLKSNTLEPMRQQLYEAHPPSKSFLEWCALDREKQRQTAPPI